MLHASWLIKTGKSYLFPVFICFGLITTTHALDGDIQSFVEHHWSHPLEIQDHIKPFPDNYPTSNSHPLAANTCGQCHQAQYAQWQSTHHAHAMGPGVLAQMLTMSTQEHLGCTRCHAPLAEQARDLQTSSKNGLHEQGVVCAACHVRNYQWFGPARKDGSTPSNSDLEQLPHGGWTVSKAFEDSRFCSSCHQFSQNGYQINGKLLQNTYQEWAQSKFAEANVTCQSCHMPGRKHEWKGIHDLNKTADGIDVIHSEIALKNNTLETSLTVSNTGTGHYFPTYVTPRVILEIYQADALKRLLENTLAQQFINRSVSLNLQTEHFDTRLAPDAQASLNYQKPLKSEANYLISRILVEPDHFYKGFYQHYLQQDIPADQRQLYAQALENAEQSDFELHKRIYSVRDARVPTTVAIPAGDFIAGSDRTEREIAYRLDEQAYGHSRTRTRKWYERERNATVKQTQAYEITLTPVTNRQYAEFVYATDYRVPDMDKATWDSYGLVHPYKRVLRHIWNGGKPPVGREDHPVVLVSKDDALAYANWLSTITGDTWRLPSELEWEKAARGTDGRWFPWGNEFNPELLNSHDKGEFDTTPVGSFPEGSSPFGILDAAGQVFEWTASDGNPGRSVVKGGSWDDKGCGVCRPAARHARPNHLKHILIGFRLIRE